MPQTEYRISGEFPQGCEGYSIWDYLPPGAGEETFTSHVAAVQWAEGRSLGPDKDGIEPMWTAEEIEDAEQA